MYIHSLTHIVTHGSLGLKECYVNRRFVEINWKEALWFTTNGKQTPKKVVVESPSKHFAMTK